MRRIKVTGYLYIDEDEYDDGPSGPLNLEAWESAMRTPVSHLDDPEFEEARDDD